MTQNSTPLAELIVGQRNGNYLMIEVCSDATFHDFYRLSRVVGKLMRFETRTWGTGVTMPLEKISAHLTKTAIWPSLEVVSEQIKYYDRARYEEYLKCAPDQLGLVKDQSAVRWQGARFPKIEMTSQDRRMMAAFHQRERRKLGLTR